MVSQHKQSPGATAVPNTTENYIGGAWTSPTNDDGQPLTRRRARNSYRSRSRGNRTSTRRSELLTRCSMSSARYRRSSAVSTFSRSRPSSRNASTTSRTRARENARRLGRRKARFAAGVPNMLQGSGNVEDVVRGLDELAIRQPLACSRGLRNASCCTPNAVVRRASTATRPRRATSASALAFVRRGGWVSLLRQPKKFLLWRPARSGTRMRSTSAPTKRPRSSAGTVSNQ
jgi:hypothetical protein